MQRLWHLPDEIKQATDGERDALVSLMQRHSITDEDESCTI